jgi:alcohol dehydrogenase class IV
MTETVFTYGAPALKFGDGAAEEVGHDLAALGVTRALVVTDPGIAATGLADRVTEQIRAAGVAAEVYAGVHVEPTDASMQAAVDEARTSGPWDGIVAIGGGSSIDTAKAVNLLLTNPGELLDYVNRPVGGGKHPERPLHPLVAVPTTTGTGAESTTVCVLDVLAQRVKSGISAPQLRPTLAVVDPLLTMTQPPEVTASAGMDILCHALESYTARPYDAGPRKRADQRVPYCGANPVADMWSERALTLLAQSFRSAVRDGQDMDARRSMAMAATFAGLGFGNAGVHIPHANAYPLAGQVRDFRPAGYPQDHAMIPHGMAVALTAAESFRFTFDAVPQRHLRAARLLEPQSDLPEDATALPDVIRRLMSDLGLPNGIAAVGFTKGDIPDLVQGSLKQQRLLAIAPRAVEAQDLEQIFAASLTLW